MKKLLILTAALVCACAVRAQKSYTLCSPDGHLRTTVAAGDELTYDIAVDGRTVLEPSPLALRLDDGRTWGPHARVRKAERTSADAAIPSPLYRSAEVSGDVEKNDKI